MAMQRLGYGVLLVVDGDREPSERERELVRERIDRALRNFSADAGILPDDEDGCADMALASFEVVDARAPSRTAKIDGEGIRRYGVSDLVIRRLLEESDKVLAHIDGDTDVPGEVAALDMAIFVRNVLGSLRADVGAPPDPDETK